MKYTDRLEEAIRFASSAHDGQLRKGKERLPYISHLVAVAILVANHTDEEDVIIAALLHDVIEDTEVSESILKNHFGEGVLSLVKTVSEPKERDGMPIEWKERKEIYIEQLKSGSDEALLISAADKIHNMDSKHRIHKEIGSAMFKHLAAKPEDYVWYHQQILDILKSRLVDHEIVEMYEERFLYEKECMKSE